MALMPGGKALRKGLFSAPHADEFMEKPEWSEPHDIGKPETIKGQANQCRPSRVNPIMH